MKEENSNGYYEEDYYGQEQATTPSDQGVVNLANFIANATNLEELNIKRCMPKSKKIRQPTVAAATNDFEITGFNENEEYITIANFSATDTESVVTKQRKSFQQISVLY